MARETFTAGKTTADPQNALRGRDRRRFGKFSFDTEGSVQKLMEKIDGKTLGRFEKELGDALSAAGINTSDVSVRFYTSWKYDNLDIIGDDIDVERSFYRLGDDIIADHHYFSLTGKYQGKGISKKVMKALYPVYKKMGVTKMRVFANIDNGGYTWAKYGFYAQDRVEAYRLAEDTGYPAAMRIVDKYYKTHSKDDGFPVHLIANQKWGRDALVGKDWEGYLDLRNKDQVRIFKNYVK